MSHDPYFLEAGTSRRKKHLLELRASTSNQMEAVKLSVNLFSEDTSCCRRRDELKQLEGRLRILEEEAKMLKGALLESVEERAKLMSEIQEHFDTIQCGLLQRELKRGELYSHWIRIFSLQNETCLEEKREVASHLEENHLCSDTDRRAGLLQILCQESNPSIVNKGLRTIALG